MTSFDSKRPIGRSRALILVVAALVLLPCGIASATVYNIQGGRKSGADPHNDGVRADISGDSFYSDSNSCVIYSVLATSQQSDRQLETGYVRCNNKQLDGTCGDVKFVEAYFGGGGSNFTCYPHGSFSLGVLHTFSVKRSFDTSSYFFAYIDGSQQESQSGFVAGNNVTVWAWGEYSGFSNACGIFEGDSTFVDMDKYVYNGGGWNNMSGTVQTVCWNVSSVDAQRTWHVSN